MTKVVPSPSLCFRDAAQKWLDSITIDAGQKRRKMRYLRDHTLRSYGQYVTSLNLFFAELPIDRIHIGHIRQYQDARFNGDEPFIRFRRPQDARSHMIHGVLHPAKGKTSCPVAEKKVNQETDTLKAIITWAGAWTPELERDYHRLEEPKSEIIRALTTDEWRYWLDTARSKPRWHLVYWYSELAWESAGSTDELRALRIGDINLQFQLIRIHDGKTSSRPRTNPLASPESQWASEQLLQRASDLGSAGPMHYLFPWRERRGPYDPTRHMTESGIRVLWNEVRDATGFLFTMQRDGRPSFRPYDTRHTALTHRAEQGMRVEDLMALAGHMSEEMTRHYARISEAHLRRQMLATQPPRKGPYSAMPFYAGNRRVL